MGHLGRVRLLRKQCRVSCISKKPKLIKVIATVNLVKSESAHQSIFGFLLDQIRQRLTFVLWLDAAIVCGEQIWGFHVGSVFNSKIKKREWSLSVKPKQTKGLESVAFTRLFSYCSHFHFVFKMNYSRGTLPKCSQTQNSPKRPMQALPFQLGSPKSNLSGDFICDKRFTALFLCSFFFWCDLHMQ